MTGVPAPRAGPASAPAPGSIAATSARPLAVRRETAVDLDGSTGLYDESGQRLIVLNTTATAVWSRCDGHLDVAGIAAELAAAHAVDPAVVRADVEATVAQLAVLGLVVTE